MGFFSDDYYSGNSKNNSTGKSSFFDKPNAETLSKLRKKKQEEELAKRTQLNTPAEEATPKKSGFLDSVFGKDAYDEFKKTHAETPNWLQPIGFGLETFNRIPLTQRLMNKGAEFMGVDRVDMQGNKLETMSTGNKTLDTLTDIGGNILGAAMTGGGGGGKSLLNATDDFSRLVGGKVASKTGGKLLPTFARGSVDAGASVALEDYSKGNLENLPQDVALNMLGGGFLFGSGQVAGDVARRFTPGIGKLLPDLANDLYDVKTKDLLGDLTTTNSKVTSSKIQPLNAKNMNFSVSGKPINPILGVPKAEVAASVEPKVSYAKIEKPDIVPPKIDTSNARIEPPNLSALGGDSALFKESQFKSNTLKNAEMLQQKETQKTIDNIHAMYEVKPNAESVERANAELSTDPQKVIDRIKNTEALNSAEDAAAAGLITNQLRQEAEKTGDYTKLKDWLETVQPKVTATAQSLQAISTWKKLTPEGALMKAQQVVGKVNRDGEKLFGKDFEKVELTADEMQFINDTMKKVEAMPEGREKDLEFAKVKKVIAEKIPVTLQDKIKALQRISLLLNPKTLLSRNPLGNLILGGLENVKDIPGALVDRAVSLKTGQRTTLAPSLEGLKTQGKGLLKGAKETLEDAKLGVNTSPSAGQFDLPDAQIFKKGVLSKFEKATNVGLELGDRPFYQAAYDDYLRQQMKIGKVEKPSEAMVEKAKAYAEERTLQNVSALVKGFKGVQEGLNQMSTGNKDLGLGTFALPFTKTPANILDKAIDYSPIGSIKAVKQLFQKGDFDQKKFVDHIGRSLTGSAMIILGYDLAKDGLLTGNANKDKDVAALEKQTGKSPYSFKVGNTYRTFDWMQPAAIPLAIGADIFNEGKNRKEATSVIGEAIKSGGTTLLSQSLLQGVQRLFGGNNIMDSIGSTISNIPTQFVPSFLKQTAQLTDDTQRDTYDPDKMQSILNQLKVRVPGASKTLEPKIDTLGREVKQFQGDNGLFNVLLNPGYTTKENATPAEKMVLDIYEKTGSKIQFPRVTSNSITYKVNKEDSKTVQLTSEEKTKLQKFIGQSTNDKFNKLINDSYFTSLTAKDKAKELQKVLTEIYNNGEEYILKGRGISEYKTK
jgi:hypothetical protein